LAHSDRLIAATFFAVFLSLTARAHASPTGATESRAICGEFTKAQERLVGEGLSLLRRQRSLLAWSFLSGSRNQLEVSSCAANLIPNGLLTRARLGELLALKRLRENGEVALRLAGLGSDRESAGLLLALEGDDDLIGTLSQSNQDRVLKHFSTPYQRDSVWLPALGSALLPGLGQAWQGAYQSAAIAFALNALAISATAEFARNGMTSAALASGFVASVVYFGNIGAAAQLADRRNRQRRDAALSESRRSEFAEFRDFYD
jgi:hypothetical protein